MNVVAHPTCTERTAELDLKRWFRRTALALLAALVVAFPAAGRPDDDDDADEAAQAARPQGGVILDANFDQWVFQGVNANGRTAPRQWMESNLALRVDAIDRACKLTDDQKKKVELAGRTDIKQFMAQYEKVRQKFLLVKNDQQKMQQIWQDINPLQTRLQIGIFDEGSLLDKSLHNNLTAEQAAAYEVVIRDRREFQRRCQIEMAVAMLEAQVPMSGSQRRELVARLSTLVKPPRTAGMYAYYALLYQMAHLPEEKLKPCFDDYQWKVVRPQIEQYKGWKGWLKQLGQLPDDDDTADAKPAAVKK